MPANRSLLRNVHFYDGSRPEEALGGLYLNPSVTVRKFIRMLDILVRASCPYSVWSRGSEFPLMTTDEPLVPGPNNMYGLTDERCIARTYSRTVNPVAFIDEWARFEAAHIFPLSHEELFRSLNYPRYVKYRSEETDRAINSCQNGLLMRSHIHAQFDSFSFAIDPDDDYKITSFRVDVDGIDGRFLDPVCRDRMDEKRVMDEFLRWHFRQTVLANMKDNGEPIFEFDFPNGSDTVGEILSGPRAADRMEAELF
ncbi:hypothetical protein V1517DRAFT_368721 [Lipomyces orientalis]|uniref:Uncharacterized protein n=1 Tax=Lipomyces orientalis TaxID=1233043 RepID=A0ACC3TJB2_9ASCO